jgi:hypothetical protein
MIARELRHRQQYFLGRFIEHAARRVDNEA